MRSSVHTDLVGAIKTEKNLKKRSLGTPELENATHRHQEETGNDMKS